MPRKVSTPAVLMASLPCASLGFLLAPSQHLLPYFDVAQAVDHAKSPPGPHLVEAPQQSRRSRAKVLQHRHPERAAMSVSAAAPDLSMSPPGTADESGEGLTSEAKIDDGLRWAEDNFPGCSTVASEAKRLPTLLAEVWAVLADPSAVQVDKPRVMMFPDCSAVAEARGLQGLYEHLEVCQDACDRFGREVSIVPHPKGGRSGAPVPALVVQCVPGSGHGDEFTYDPAWDDDWDIDRSLLGDDDEEGGGVGLGDGGDGAGVDTAALAIVPGSDEEITELTKTWVQAVITDMGVCPFSVDASRAGLPVGNVRYPVTREQTAEAIYREYWREVDLLASEEDERSLSTTLLITPEFALNNAEAFEIIGQTLTQPLEALHLEDDIQLVFFHPQYAFRDGQDRMGSGGAANYARRSPFPMINILRTNQVRLAQKSIPTGLVYKQNEEVLDEVGAHELQKMLERRDWTGLQGKKVDRKRVDYYETARKLQGVDMSPAATPEVPEVPSPQTPAAAAVVEGPKPGSEEFSGTDMASAREALSAAAEAMESSYEQGFSADVDIARSGPGAAGISGETGLPQAAEVSSVADAPGRVRGLGASEVLPAAAATSAGIADEDLRTVATTLVKRIGSGVPLKNPAAFEEFSEAVDRVLSATAR